MCEGRERSWASTSQLLPLLDFQRQMSYPKTCVLNHWPAQAGKTFEGEERGKEGVNHSPPSAAPDEVSNRDILKEALPQFMLQKSILCFGSLACAFAGIKMLYRWKGDCKAGLLEQYSSQMFNICSTSRLPLSFWRRTLRCVTPVLGAALPEGCKGPVHSNASQDAAREASAAEPVCLIICRMQIPTGSPTGSLAILLINQILRGWL